MQIKKNRIGQAIAVMLSFALIYHCAINHHEERTLFAASPSFAAPPLRKPAVTTAEQTPKRCLWRSIITAPCRLFRWGFSKFPSAASSPPATKSSVSATTVDKSSQSQAIDKPPIESTSSSAPKNKKLFSGWRRNSATLSASVESDVKPPVVEQASSVVSQQSPIVSPSHIAQHADSPIVSHQTHASPSPLHDGEQYAQSSSANASPSPIHTKRKQRPQLTISIPDDTITNDNVSSPDHHESGMLPTAVESITNDAFPIPSSSPQAASPTMPIPTAEIEPVTPNPPTPAQQSGTVQEPLSSSSPAAPNPPNQPAAKTVKFENTYLRPKIIFPVLQQITNDDDENEQNNAYLKQMINKIIDRKAISTNQIISDITFSLNSNTTIHVKFSFLNEVWYPSFEQMITDIDVKQISWNTLLNSNWNYNSSRRTFDKLLQHVYTPKPIEEEEQ